MTGAVTPHFLTETRSPESGKLDARLIARALEFSMRELARVTNRDASGLSRHPTSDRLQPYLQELDDLALQLRDTFGTHEIARMWLRASNPVLAEASPMSYLLRGDIVAINKLLQMAETGTPT